MTHTTANTKDTCDQFLDNLDQWLAFELDAEHSSAMQLHHDACPACQLETRLARAIDLITVALPQQVCPPLKLPVSKKPGIKELISRLLTTWRQPLVYVPAAAAVLVTLVVIQLRIADAPVAPVRVVINGQEYTQEEIMKAAADLEIALRYLDKYGSYPARVVSAELENSRLPLPPPQERGITPAI